MAFDESKYPEGKVLAFVCPQCGAQFKIKLGRKVVKTATGEEKEVKEPDFSCGYITIIENGFAFKQDLPLVMGDNVIGRRNKFVYMVRDFPSLTVTFVKYVLVGKKEQVRIGEGTIVTIGATTFILHSANEGEEEE